MRIEAKRAESAGQARQLHVQFLGVRALGNTQMAQRPQAGVQAVQKPGVGDTLGGESGDRPAPRLLGTGDGAAFLLQHVDQPPHHRHQRRTRADLEARGEEVFVENELAGSLPAHARQGKHHHPVRALRAQQELDVLPAQLDHLDVAAGILVGQRLLLGQVACRQRSLGFIQCAVESIGPQFGNRQQNVDAVLHGGKQLGNAARLGEFIELRHVKTEAVGKHAAGVGECHGAVAQGFRVQVVAAKPERLVPDARRGKLNGVFEIPVLRLKMVWSDVHAFRPDHTREILHPNLSRDSFGMVPLLTPWKQIAIIIIHRSLAGIGAGIGNEFLQ